MSTWRYAAAGMLGLALLEAAVSSNAAATRAGGLLTAVAGVIERILSPSVAAIPDLRKHGGAAPPPPAAQQSASGGSLIPPDWTTSPAPPQTI